MLGISADYLLALTDTAHAIKTGIPADSTFAKAMAVFQSLNAEGREAALAMLTGLSGQAIYKKCHSTEAVSENA
ncbi:MAG: hypothetical protein GX592_13830 [Clostridiales bacterium]|nr:hypothetical protein [Clostridiales bacterium]